MELRELRAFVAAAHELHFARAAAGLYMNPSTMSELIRKLEQELGTALFTRTTRRITLTDAGTELLGRAELILDLTTQATEAVTAIARGSAGAIQVGCTPPARPTIAPHLARCFTASRPGASVDIQRMWLPALGSALQAGTIDVAITCGDLGIVNPNILTAEIGSEQLLVGLRADNPLAGKESVELRDLGEQTLGMHPGHLFPAWYAVQRQILTEAGVTPPIAELEDTDLTARRWSEQPEVEWIMVIGSLLAAHERTVTRPAGAQAVPFTISWSSQSAQRPLVRQFIDASLAAELPSGWLAPANG